MLLCKYFLSLVLEFFKEKLFLTFSEMAVMINVLEKRYVANDILHEVESIEWKINYVL